MSKILYVDKDFNDEHMDIIDKANEIIEEFQEDGMDLSLRQLYYQFVSRGLFINDTKMYKRFGSIIGDGRLAGLIDWEAIEDRGRNLQRNNHWDNPGQVLQTAYQSFQLNHWKGQDFHIEVWIEKEALIGVIAPICEELDVPYFACKGYVSLSEMWNSAQRLIEASEDGQDPVIIHLGDHDPSGMDMSRDIYDRQRTFRSSIQLERIALNMDQIEEYGPPPNPAKLSDSRSNSYVSEYGYDSWELDALNPLTLRELIRNTVESYRDENIYGEVIAQEIEHKDTLAKIAKNWKKLK